MKRCSPLSPLGQPQSLGLGALALFVVGCADPLPVEVDSGTPEPTIIWEHDTSVPDATVPTIVWEQDTSGPWQPDATACPFDKPAANCPCAVPGKQVCTSVGSGLSCTGGVWSQFSDGLCHPAACISPFQNLNLAYTEGAVGCACSASDKEVCVGRVAFICDRGKWDAVEDGPCALLNPPRQTYTPAQCSAIGGVALTDPGDGSLLRAGCPARTQLLGNVSGYIEGGLCCERKACGARAGNTCAADEYCAYEPSGICGTADAESTCQPRPKACDANYDPVCACNQKTYSNSCQAALAGTGVYYRGPCK